MFAEGGNFSFRISISSPFFAFKARSTQINSFTTFSAPFNLRAFTPRTPLLSSRPFERSSLSLACFYPSAYGLSRLLSSFGLWAIRLAFSICYLVYLACFRHSACRPSGLLAPFGIWLTFPIPRVVSLGSLLPIGVLGLSG